MNTEQLKEQASRLEDYINKGVVPKEEWGLCRNVLGAYFPDHVFTTWEHSSGSYTYPIEGYYEEFAYNGRKHDRRTKYGKLRLSLAKHCLEWTLTQLGETT